MGLFDFLGFGKKRKETITDFQNRGAIVIDVRSKAEFQSGNVKGSICIPLEAIQGQVKSIQKKKKPVLLVCATGRRSGMANSLLQQKGIESFNAGGWRNLA